MLTLAVLMLLVPVQAGASAKDPGACAREFATLESMNSRFDVENAIKHHGLEIVREANERIETIIAQSCRMAERAHCEVEVDCIVASMLIRTRAVSSSARVAASMCGVKTVCEYVDVTIGGRVVPVDPLRVVSL